MLEDRVRRALHEVAAATDVSPAWDTIAARSSHASRRRWVVPALASIVLLVAAGVVVVQRVGERAQVISTASPLVGRRVSFPDGLTVDVAAFSGQGRLAFVSRSRLYILDGAAGTVRQVTRTGDASDLAWSADGRWLAFTVRDAPGYEDYTPWIVRADGTRARSLDAGSIFAWSPRGHRLAIVGRRFADGLLVVTPEGGRRKVAEFPKSFTFAWSPDGRTLAYATNGPGYAVLTVPATGGRPVARITGTDADRYTKVSWWPDGEGLLVVHQQLDLTSGDQIGGDLIESLVLATGVRRTLVPNRAVSWSPDGTRFAVGSDALAICDPRHGCEKLPFPTGHVVALGGSGLTVVGPASWSPDGRYLGYVLEPRDGSTGDVWVQAPDGSSARRLERIADRPVRRRVHGVLRTFGQGATVPQWSADGTLLLYRDGERLRIAAVDGGTPPVTLAEPVGFTVHANSDQGLPGGSIVAWSR